MIFQIFLLNIVPNVNLIVWFYFSNFYFYSQKSDLRLTRRRCGGKTEHHRCSRVYFTH